jgi:phospholipid transport system substrate-binding protein
MKKIIKTLTLLVAIISLSTTSCLASDELVNNFIQVNVDKIIAVVHSEGTANKDSKLIAIFESIVDVDWMAKFTMGSNWGSLTDEQRALYSKAYKSYLLKTYLPKLEKNHSNDYKIIGIESIGDEQSTAHLLISEGPKNTKVQLDYRVKCQKDRCYIRDVTVEGISLISSQRADFASVFNNSGFAGLMAALDRKNS